MVEVPKPGAVIHRVINPGIPLVAGFAGLALGDVVGATALMAEFTGGTEAALPFSSRIDYNSFLGMVPWAIGLGISEAIFHVAFSGGGTISSTARRAIRWFIFGVIAHLFLSAILPGKVAPSATLVLPAPVR